MKAQRRAASTLLAAVLLSLLLSSALPPAEARSLSAPEPPASPPAATAFRSAPLMFIENVGQFDDRVRYQVYGIRSTLYITDSDLWLTAGSNPSMQTPTDQQLVVSEIRNRPDETGLDQYYSLRISFDGANPASRPEPFERLDTRVSYLRGDSSSRLSNIPVWAGVRYADLYPGLDLEIASESGQWVWRAVINDSDAASSPLDNVRLRVEGADALALDGGYLRLSTPAGDFGLPLLQMISTSKSQSVKPKSNPAILGNTVVRPFAASSARSTSPIPPGTGGLLYSTFLRGVGGETANGLFHGGADAIAVDDQGNAYIVGGTAYSDFPTTSDAFDTSYGGNGDAFVAKLNSTGDRLIYATFLGGSNREWADNVAVDREGCAYVTGMTTSLDFPVTPDALQSKLAGEGGPFMAKLDANGSGLIYATLLNERGIFLVSAIAIDDEGSLYMAGKGASLIVPGSAPASGNFVAKLDRDSREFMYLTTMVPGAIADMAVDEKGQVYVTGWTAVSKLPPADGGFVTSAPGGLDAFVAKLSDNGSRLIYATFLGGPRNDTGMAIAIDQDGCAYVTGQTQSKDFPTTPGALSTGVGAFVTKLNSTGTAWVYSTLLGGKEITDWGRDIAVDGQGNAFVCGETGMRDFPTTSGAFDMSFGGVDDAFVSKLGATGELEYSTFIGGKGGDVAAKIAVDKSGNLYVLGGTGSADFPVTVGASGTERSAGGDSFVAKFSLGAAQKPITGAPTVEPTSVSGPTPTKIPMADVRIEAPFKFQDQERDQGFPPSQMSVGISVTNSSQISVTGTLILYANDAEVSRERFPDGAGTLAPMQTAFVWIPWALGQPYGKLENVELRVVAQLENSSDRNPADNTYKEPVSVYWSDFLMDRDAYQFPNEAYSLADFWSDLQQMQPYLPPLTFAQLVAALSKLMTQWSGRCFGMSATSIVYKMQPNLRPGGYATTYAISPEDAWPAIGKYHSAQIILLFRELLIGFPPFDASKEVQKVVELLSQDPPKPAELSLKPSSDSDGGHSVVAYKALKADSGWTLFLYDSNTPYDNIPFASAQIRIDNTGQLQVPAYSVFYAHDINPLLDDALAEVARETGQEWQVSADRLVVFVGSPVEVVITDAQGRRIGTEGGRELSEIPDGEMWRVAGETVFALPNASIYSINVIALSTAPPDSTMTVAYAVPGEDGTLLEVSYDAVPLIPGQAYATVIDADAEERSMQLPDGKVRPPDRVEGARSEPGTSAAPTDSAQVEAIAPTPVPETRPAVSKVAVIGIAVVAMAVLAIIAVLVFRHRRH